MKLVDIKGNITQKQRLVLVITFLLALVIIFYILRTITTKPEGIDYKNTDSMDLLISSSEINDRNIYWNLNEIISQFINSYQSSFNNEIKDLDYYYGALDPNYKKFLGKKKYIENSNNLITKVIGENKDVFSMLPEQLITSMYRLDDYDNAYLCKLTTVNETEEAYIGIILDTDHNKYNIFYIN